MTVTAAKPQPAVWAIHDGKAGMASQVIGLAEALGWPFVAKRIAIRLPWRYLMPRLWLAPLRAIDAKGDQLTPPWPDLVIGCGRAAIAPALAVKRASGDRTFWVQIQDPRFARAKADLLVIPAHDPATGANVFRTLGAVHRVTSQRLAADAARFAALFANLPRPLIAVLVGGDNDVYRMSEARFTLLCDQLVWLGRRGYGLAVTPSRRTGPQRQALLRQRLKGLPAYVWDGGGDNPYFGLLGEADAFIATADSVSMISEAASTGKPVHIVELDGGSRKFARFHAGMQAAGITRPFEGAIGSWQYAPPDDTARAAAEIRRRFASRRVELA
jgi:uncharacterized protein